MTAKIIVIADKETHAFLTTCGADWDTQTPVETAGELWDALSEARVDPLSTVLVFSDRAVSAPGDLEIAIAIMAPAAPTFLIAWDLPGLDGLLTRIAAAAEEQNVDPQAPVYVLPADHALMMEGFREVFSDPAHGVVIPPVAPAAAPVAESPVYQPPVATTPEPVYASEPVYVPPSATFPTPVPVTQAPAAPVFPVAPQHTPPVAAHQTPTHYVAPANPTRPQGQVTLAVTSAKGGSGKSTTALCTASQIAHSSRKAFEAGMAERPLKVVLVDMDTRDGQVASLIGQYMPTSLNIRIKPEWDEATVLANLVHDDRLGIDCLLAPIRPKTADDVGPDFYRTVIRVLQQTHDVVIMDTSVNYLDPLISTVCLPEATAILFVTTLATTSVHGMARALREITEPIENGGMGISRDKIGVVVNQAVTEIGMERDQVVEAALQVPLVGSIPLATKDVLVCTNHNKMYKLLEHQTLGPAYFKLAQVCLPKHTLLPLIGAQAQTAHLNGNSHPATETDDGGGRRRLLGRR